MLFSRRRCLRVENVQFLARFEAHRFARGNIDFSSGPGIAPDPGLSRPHIENTEAAQLNAVSVRQGFLEALKNGVDCSLSFYAGQSRAFDYVMDDVLFNQCLHPETLKNFVGYFGAGVMLERFLRIVNERSVS